MVVSCDDDDDMLAMIPRFCIPCISCAHVFTDRVYRENAMKIRDKDQENYAVASRLEI